jgi:hypothetical protein
MEAASGASADPDRKSEGSADLSVCGATMLELR